MEEHCSPEGTYHFTRWLSHLRTLHQSHLIRALEGYDVHRGDLPIFIQLSKYDRPLCLGEIARESLKDRSRIGTSAKRLEKLGYVEFVPNRFHKTKKDVRLTEKGARVAADLGAALDEWTADLSSRLPEGLLDQLERDLRLATEAAVQLEEERSERSAKEE